MIIFHNLGHSFICNHSSFIAMCLLPVKTEMDFHERCKKNNILEITNLLGCWPMLFIFGRKALEIEHLK